MRTSGIRAFLEMLASAGVKYIFGNPGTTELPLMDALADDSRFRYILAPQEVPAVAMADGYAQASRSLGVVNLHISCGLGNAMGMLYNAHREGTPLLITAGQQDRRLMFEEPILWSDMARVAAPWTKWSAEITRVQDLPSALRRAAQTALTPPTGPVFLSIPIDVQTEIAELDLTWGTRLDVRVGPPLEALARAADVLAGAKKPVILAGSRVVEADAVAELVALAEAIGSPVMCESGTTHGRLPFPADHRLAAPGLPLWSPEIHERLAKFDVALVVGMDLLRLYVYFEPARAIPESLRIVHLDQEAWQLGKNYPLEVGLWGDPRRGLTELRQEIGRRYTPPMEASAWRRCEDWAERHARLRGDLGKRLDEEKGRRPLTPLGLMGAVARSLPNDVAVIEEAVTTTNTYLERLGALKNTTGYFGHRGWALGWGLGCALGVKLAWPDRPVLALLGEGAAMYGIQGLWTAAHEKIPVTFVICNNSQYQILKVGARQLGLPAASEGRFVGLDLAGPEFDLVGLARSLGVEARRITEPQELTEALVESWSSDRPRLFDVPVERQTPERLLY